MMVTKPKPILNKQPNMSGFKSKRQNQNLWWNPMSSFTKKQASLNLLELYIRYQPAKPI